MNCADLENRMIGFLDGRLSATEREELERHFAACASCRSRAEELRRLWHVLDEMPAIEASAVFDLRLRERLQAEAPPVSSLWGWLVPQFRMVLATGALLAFALVLLRLPQPNSPGRPAPGGGLAPMPMQSAGMTNPDEQLKLLENLPVLEDYEMLDSFEALSELPAQQPTSKEI